MSSAPISRSFTARLAQFPVLRNFRFPILIDRRLIRPPASSPAAKPPAAEASTDEILSSLEKSYQNSATGAGPTQFVLKECSRFEVGRQYSFEFPDGSVEVKFWDGQQFVLIERQADKNVSDEANKKDDTASKLPEHYQYERICPKCSKCSSNFHTCNTCSAVMTGQLRWTKSLKCPKVAKVELSGTDRQRQVSEVVLVSDEEPDGGDCERPAAHAASECRPAVVRHVPDQHVLRYPTPRQRGAIAITTEDLACLDDDEFLNDKIIDFYNLYIWGTLLSPADRSRTHIFNSFFYQKLSTALGASVEQRHKKLEQLRKWSKDVDLFSKDFLIVPINEQNHWYLAIICFLSLLPSPFVMGPGCTAVRRSGAASEGSADSGVQRWPVVLILDSLGKQRPAAVRNLREYVFSEWVARGKSAPPALSAPQPLSPLPPNAASKAPSAAPSPPRPLRLTNPAWLRGTHLVVPKQDNLSDCGLYLLHNVETFFMRPLLNFHAPFPNLSNWFDRSVVAGKRDAIRRTILLLANESSAGDEAAANESSRSEETAASKAAGDSSERSSAADADADSSPRKKLRVDSPVR